MPSYDHNKLITRISQIGKVPELDAEYVTWIKSDRQLTLLRENAKEDELIIYGRGDHTFIYTVVVNENNLSPLDKDDLLVWGCLPSFPVASYTYGGGRDDVWIERTGYPWGSKTLEGARQLVFVRNFEGFKEKDGLYFEILQEYAHLTEIHWRPEQHAYCRFDENGDFDHIVSITSKEDKGDVSLVSFKREPLELYLAASNSVLIRMFDFILYRRDDFCGWPDGAEDTVAESDILFYRQKIVDEHAGYSRGIQIIPPSRPKAEIFSSIKASWSGENGKEYVEFIAYDWRNKCITKISTDPTATTNYFQTDGNSLPFELSPAFFRPEVLLKYKGDSDKYTVESNNIYCRDRWWLRDYDVNEAGQVHAYICDLRRLPYQEQLHWLSYNEEPKTGISERFFANHFKNQWVDDPDSLEKVVSNVRKWAESDLTWWKLREETLLNGVSIPRTSSRDEWAKAFIELSKLVIEGFECKAIRKRLGGLDIDFNKEERSISLLEKLLVGRHKLDDGQKLEGLRTVQHIRSTFVHSSSDAAKLANHALKEYETYSAHFENVCGTIAHELELIEQAFS